MAKFLDEIMARTRVAVDERKRSAGVELLERNEEMPKPRGFAAALREVARTRPAVIAEMKRRSPSRGVLCEDYRPAQLADGYEVAGAAALSVLTDEDFFGGSLGDLADVCDRVRIPVLRKDFILDPFQMVEARAVGADAVLLIVAAHGDATLRALADEAGRLELDVLCEVHDREEAQRAVDLGFETIGVNCRDLKTMEMDLTRHTEVARWLPDAVLRVAESGIKTAADVRRLRDVGYQAFLVGETLMRRGNPGVGLRELLGEAEGPGAREQGRGVVRDVG